MFISVTDGDKPAATQLAAGFHDMGFAVLATGGTAQAIRRMGVPVERIRKLSEGSPNVVERIDAGEVALVINTPTGSGARADGWEIRRAAVGRGVPCITTMSGASAAQRAIRARRVGRGRGDLAAGASRARDRRRGRRRRSSARDEPARRAGRAAHPGARRSAASPG